MTLTGAVFTFPGGLAAGFAALIMTGLSWSLVGIVMGGAPRRNVDTGLVQFAGAIVTLTISIITVFSLKNAPEWGNTLPVLCYFFTGVINYTMLQLMSLAMQKGPNGVIWGMIQSGTVCPFLMGVIFFDVSPTVWRLTGLVMLIAALFAFGSTKPESGGGAKKQWLPLTLLAFCMCGFQQCLTSMPSYFEDFRTMSPVVRTLLVAIGTVTVSLTVLLVNCYRFRTNIFREQVKKTDFWRYVIMLQFFGLIAAYFLTYNGMDTLAEAGMGAVSYPLMVASCIVGFSFYSIVWLREKNCWQQYLAFAMCLSGIICLCIVS